MDYKIISILFMGIYIVEAEQGIETIDIDRGKDGVAQLDRVMCQVSMIQRRI